MRPESIFYKNRYPPLKGKFGDRKLPPLLMLCLSKNRFANEGTLLAKFKGGLIQEMYFCCI